ncbi:MAG: anti-sigma F factor [Lachnospiraceae bacterium]|nr:anti-sigma F factor [Lachnospiraceae bacterium]
MEIRMETKFNMKFDSIPGCEGFARVTAAAFAARLNPTVEELEEFKTAVSEAVTNCMIHAYDGREGPVKMEVSLRGRTVTVKIEDEGRGIEDLEKAMQACYTTKPELERSGMGFTFMQLFMDDVSVKSSPADGTEVIMTRRFADVKGPILPH